MKVSISGLGSTNQTKKKKKDLQLTAPRKQSAEQSGLNLCGLSHYARRWEVFRHDKLHVHPQFAPQHEYSNQQGHTVNIQEKSLIFCLTLTVKLLLDTVGADFKLYLF